MAKHEVTITITKDGVKSIGTITETLGALDKGVTRIINSIADDLGISRDDMRKEFNKKLKLNNKKLEKEGK